MICPMMTIKNAQIAAPHPEHNPATHNIECLRKDCAWWENRTEKCSVWVIANTLLMKPKV